MPSPDGSRIYVALTGNASQPATVGVIDTRTNTLAGSLGAGIHPGGLAVSPDGRSLYVIGYDPSPASPGGSVTVLDTVTGAATPIAASGLDGPSGVALTPDGRRLLIANHGTDQAPGSTVTVIDTATRTVTDTVSVPGAPLGVATSPDSHHAFVVGDRLWRIDLP